MCKASQNWKGLNFITAGLPLNGNAEDIWRKIEESKDGLQKIKETSEYSENETDNWK